MMRVLPPVALAIVLVSGCSGPPPAASDVIGTWIADDGGTFKFSEDGTFTATNLDEQEFFRTNAQQEGSRVSGIGTWALGESVVGHWYSVKLDFDAVGDEKGGYSGLELCFSGDGAAESQRPRNRVSYPISTLDPSP